MLEVTLSFRASKVVDVPVRSRSRRFGKADCRYRLMAMIMGRVIISDKVERQQRETDGMVTDGLLNPSVPGLEVNRLAKPV
jgi:hypothetical protein